MADEEKAAQPQPRRSRPTAQSSDDPFAEAQEKGYLGERPEGEYDDEEYSLQSGPDSPPYPLNKE